MPRYVRTGLQGLFGAFVAALCATPVWACVVCIELPEDTLTDRLWSADAVALARPSAENRFVYAPFKVLRGTLDDPMPFLVDSVSRRRMAENPALAALILRQPDGAWELAGQGDGDYTAFVQRVLASQAAWSDEIDDPDRIRAFWAMHDHPSPTLRRLALTELARLPYGDLRELDVRLPVAWIAARLTDPAWTGWQPVLVHLLGLHEDPRAHALVRERAFEIWMEARTPWLVALIEIDGADAVERIVTEALREGDAASAAVAIAALNLQAQSAPEHAPALLPALRRLVGEDPARAALAVPGLRSLGDTSWTPEVAAMLTGQTTIAPADRFSLRSYLSWARWGDATPPSRMEMLEGRARAERATQ